MSENNEFSMLKALRIIFGILVIFGIFAFAADQGWKVLMIGCGLWAVVELLAYLMKK